MGNIFYSLLSCEKYKLTRQRILRETWLSKVPPSDYVFLSDEHSDDSVKMSDKKDYSSCEEKQLNSLNYLLKNKLNYEWYFFGDDDTYVNPFNLTDFLSSFTEESVGSSLNKLSDPRNGAFDIFNINAYYSGGAGFVFSKKTLNSVDGKLFPPSIFYADISMGRLLLNCGGKITDCNRFFATNFSELKHSEETIKRAITYHYMNESQMKKAYELSFK